MRNAVLLSCFALTFGLTLVGGWFLACSPPDTRTLEMTVISPDGAWQARVYANAWQGWWGLGLDRQQSVEISNMPGEPVAAPASNNAVVRFNAQRGGAVVAVLWKNARHLLIVTSEGTRPAGFWHTVAGIGSSVRHYDPNRPKQAACIAAFRRAVAAGPVVTPPAPCAFWVDPAT